MKEETIKMLMEMALANGDYAFYDRLEKKLNEQT